MTKKVSPPGGFPQRLRHAMTLRRLSQVQLAKEIGTSQTNVSRWLGGTIPEMKFALVLSKRLGITIEWLLEGTGHGPDKLKSLLAEIREYQIPTIDKKIARFRKIPDSGTEPIPTLISSLLETKARYERMVEFAEKHGDAGLQSEYLSQENTFEGSVAMKKIDAMFWRSRACACAGLPYELSDAELDVEFAAFQKRAEQIGHVKAAVENLKKHRKK